LQSTQPQWQLQPFRASEREGSRKHEMNTDGMAGKVTQDADNNTKKNISVGANLQMRKALANNNSKPQ